MTGFLEYDVVVRRSFSPSVAFLTALAVVLFLAVSVQAQINGAPPSVTSPGFGGNAINGPRSSVTSVGPQGYAPPFRGPFPAGNGDGFHHVHDGNHGHGNGDGNHGNGNGDGHRGHRQDSGAVGPVWYAYPVPYAIDSAPPEDQSEDAAENDADYQGGPTVFDRRGSGERSYVPPAKDPAPAHASQRTQEEPPAVDPDPPLPPTLLVFKDGRTAEVANYAIVGPTLFDLTPGHRRKIPIMDLDLEATRRQNDERGVTFQLPQSGQGN